MTQYNVSSPNVKFIASPSLGEILESIKPKVNEYWYIRLLSHSTHLISVQILELTGKTVAYTTDYAEEFRKPSVQRYELSEVKFVEKFIFKKSK